MLSLMREKRSMSTTSTACWRSRVIALADLFDRLGEAETVGQPGEAVPEHLGPERPFGLSFDGAIDKTEQATGHRSLALGKRR